jgi:D-alanyl-D-alanine carboxypeptidase
MLRRRSFGTTPLQPMNPASAMKLVTTYAALELLGPAYTWKTEALADAQPGNGRLDGNLYLRGSGDPRLALEHFWQLLRQLRTRGITESTATSSSTAAPSPCHRTIRPNSTTSRCALTTPAPMPCSSISPACA